MKKKEESQQEQLDAVDGTAASPEVATLEDSILPAGVVLANERKAQDQTVEQIAKELNLSAATIRALETDQADGLPELTYVRGYIRSYARLLGLDPEAIIAAYAAESTNGNHVNFDEIPQGLSEEDFQVSPRRSSWLKWLVLASIAAMVVYWWSPPFLQELLNGASVTRSQSAPVSNTSDNSPNNASTQIEPSAASNNTAQVEALEDLDVVAQGSSLIESAESGIESEAQPAQATTDVAANTLASENVLVLSFASTCWVDARDSQGTRLAYQSVVGGEQLELTSNLAMTIFLGNAEGVSATLNGEAFDLAEFRQGVYAKFTIESVTESAQ